MIAKVLVGYSTHRPIRPDELAAVYLVAVDVVDFDFDAAENEARRVAVQWCASRPWVTATSADVISVEV